MRMKLFYNLILIPDTHKLKQIIQSIRLRSNLLLAALLTQLVAQFYLLIQEIQENSEEKQSARRPRSRLETVVFPVRCDGAGAADMSETFGSGIASGCLWLSNCFLAAVFSRWAENLHSKQPVRLAFFRGADGA